MEILYGYSNCSQKKYEELFEQGVVAVAQASQKYHHLLIEGLAVNETNVQCFSGMSINRQVEKRILVKHEDEEQNNMKYHYYRTINIPGIRHLCIFFGGFFQTLKNWKKRKNAYVICDCLSLANAYGMVLGAKVLSIPTVAIVTDLPRMMYKNPMVLKVANKLCSFFDGFILLTQDMNEEVNVKGKPFIVLEGHVDAQTVTSHSQEAQEISTKTQVIMYAGSLLKIYGIEILVKGFLDANIPNTKLVIYGDGDYADDLRKICEHHSNIDYRGVALNSEIINEERKAALLVNPRPTTMEFTKFSFPSKNMEYMVSGTPMLTTNLPGMPKEYKEYVYVLEDESIEGMSACLKQIFNECIETRKEKGKKAQEFVLKNKTNNMQAAKVIGLLKKLKRG